MADLGQPPEDIGLAGPALGTGTETGGLVDSWRQWVARPENRAGLVQFGLQMMQPVSPGQTPMGAISTSVGEGFEARDRQLKDRAEAQVVGDKLGLEGERVDVAREGVRAREGVSINSLFRAQQSQTKDYAKFVQGEAKSIAAQANDRLAAGNNPYPEFAGKSEQEIREFILNDPTWKQRLQTNFGAMYGGTSPGAPQGTAPGAGATPTAPTAPVLTEDWIKTNAPAWAKVRAGLQSPDPGMKERAQKALGIIRQRVSDPQVLEQLVGG